MKLIDDLVKRRLIRFLKIVLLVFLIILSLIIISLFPLKFWVERNYRRIGQEKIQETALNLSTDETDLIEILHKIADWEDNNIKRTYANIYFYPFFPFFVCRKSPPIASYTMMFKRGACEEFAVLFRALTNASGIKSRVVYNKAEDHSWNEVYINGSWIHFDTTVQREKRFNNPGLYERPESEGGWGKQLSYVYFEDSNSVKHDITEKYTNTGRLIVKVEKNGTSIENATVSIYSKFLMENKPNKYKPPRFCLDGKTNDQGICIFDLGGNNYRIEVLWDKFSKHKKTVDVSLQESTEVTVKIEL